MQEKRIGEVIAEAREKAGFSQRQLAKIANVSNAEISKIESGEREIPNPKTLRKISNYIDVNYNEMMYMIGLGIEVSPLNPFIKDYYSSLKGEELNNAEINVLGSIENAEKLVSSCKNNLEKKDITEQEIELLNNTIKDTEYQNDTLKETIRVIKLRKADLESKTLKGKK